MGARNREGIGLLYRPAGLNRLAERLAELIPWNRFLDSLKFKNTGSELVSLPQNGSERHSKSIFLFFVARKKIPSCVLFCGMVRNRVPRISVYFGSTERNSELFSLPQKGSEQNYGSLFIFWSTERNSELFSLPRKGLEQPEFLRK
jgi:hypothetical protein